MRRYDQREIDIKDIWVSPGRRPISEESVAALAGSIEKLGGLITPITVRDYDGDGEFYWHLIAGAHRVAAMKSLRHTKITAAIYECTATEARMWEIAENLKRADLTVLERRDQLAEWVGLCEKADKEAAEKLGQLGPVSMVGGRGKEGGERKAARNLGVTRAEVRRANKVAGLKNEAKAVAVEVGLDDNESALLAAAKHTSKEEQIAALREKAAERASRQARVHGEVKDTKGDAREVLAQRIADNITGEDLADVTSALAILGLKEVVARIQALTGAVFDNTRAGAAA